MRTAAAPPRRSIAPTTYRADPAITARVRQEFVEAVNRSDAWAEAAVDHLLATRDVFSLWIRQGASDGLRRGDAADAVAAYWVTTWLISQRLSDAPPGGLRAVSEQVHAALGRDPAFVRLSDTQRQEIAATFIYDTIIPASLYGAALQQGDAAGVAQASAAAVSGARAMLGVNLRALELTARGFRLF